MLDGVVKPLIDPALGRLAGAARVGGLSADAVTVVGLLVGLAAAAAIVGGWMLAGLALILLSRLADGIDGALARATRPTDRGGYLDIVFDYCFYGVIPLAFAIHNPARNALAASVLLATFYANCASFLAFAVMAEKRGANSQARGQKSFVFSVGLAEAGETLITFAAFCLFPAKFSPIAYVFAALCAWTCGARILLARQVFADPPTSER